jgi:hypothetical protein
MNNTFDFNRFKNLLLKDGKMYIRNYGTGLIVVCCLNAIFWIFNLLFGTSSDPAFRLGMLFTWTALAMMMVPEKVYGKANLSREGVSFAMLPASSLEKFISMFLYCAIVTPVVVFFGGYLVDALLSLFPFGGFEKPIHLYSLNELVRMANDSEGVIQAGDMSLSIDELFHIGAIRFVFYMLFVMWASIYMLGNMIFKKHKAGKTFACYLGISYLISTIFGALFFANAERMELWAERFEDYAGDDVIRLLNYGTTMSVVIVILITAVLLYFTYRKIKTQKY